MFFFPMKILSTIYTSDGPTTSGILRFSQIWEIFILIYCWFLHYFSLLMSMCKWMRLHWNESSELILVLTTHCSLNCSLLVQHVFLRNFTYSLDHTQLRMQGSDMINNIRFLKELHDYRIYPKINNFAYCQKFCHVMS